MTTTTQQMSQAMAARLTAADYITPDMLKVGDRIALVGNGRVAFWQVKNIPTTQTDPVWFTVKLRRWPTTELLRHDGLYPVERAA